MNVKEFRSLGYLHELNRQFLHPLGLAMAVSIAEDGQETLGPIYDARDDPEGYRYAETDAQKAQHIMELQQKRLEMRRKLLGYQIQSLEAGKDGDAQC